ncbi:tetratricopeptide repeat protein [Marinactinospora thermotolerans]|uniref:tetratricopeptide repeat protein n=1 Tax=Marinactinospora thermotolerans TaxID=531310 RepID=UPI003D94EF1B
MRWVWVGGSAAVACIGLAVALFLSDLETLSWIAGAGSFVIAVPSLVLALLLARPRSRPDPGRPAARTTANRIGSNSGASQQAETVNAALSEVGRHGDTYSAETINIIRPPADPPGPALREGAADWAGMSTPMVEADPRALGVHPARRGDDGGDLPPYVARDVDAELEGLLLRAGERGGAVVVEGDSTAGKTRALLHVLRRTLPHRRLYAPVPGDDLRELAAHLASSPPREGAVVWLDDMNRFLGQGRRGLSERVLGEFLRCGAVVAATLRAEYADAYRTTASDGGGYRLEGRGRRENDAALLRRFIRVGLERVWSDAETERAAETGDGRLVEAAAHHGTHGIAEYLAAGPELLRAWRDARRSTARGGHPRGYAVVAAAVDLDRTGLLTAPTPSLLERTHQIYMAGLAALRPEPFEQALEWACRPGDLGASGLLVPADDAGERWWPFDYLVEATASPVPLSVWAAALDHAADDDERLAIADNADDAGHRDLAATVCEPLARTGHPRALFLMGYWAHDRGDLAEAEEWYRRAADSGDPHALLTLGSLLEHQDRRVEAEEVYLRAVEAGDLHAPGFLGQLLADQERFAEAEEWYQRAADSGDPIAPYALGRMLQDLRRLAEAEAWYRRAIDVGDTDAPTALAHLLAEQGRHSEAEEWYRRAIDAGDTRHLISLGNLFADQGRFDDAEEWYLRAIDSGDKYAESNLNLLFVRHGRFDKAEERCRRAIDAGDTGALSTLAHLLAEQGRHSEAEEWYRRAIDAGDAFASYGLERLLAEQGRRSEAEQAYRHAADTAQEGEDGGS